MNLDQIISGCQSGDRISQKELYGGYRKLLFGVIRRYIRDVAKAEDVLTNVFVKIFEKINTFQGKGSFEGWMRRIAVNESLMALRKHSREFSQEDAGEYERSWDPGPVERMAVEELMEKVRALPEGYRVVFNLYVIEGYKHREIADLLGISIHTSKSQLIMAKKRLREMIEQNKKSE